MKCVNPYANGDNLKNKSLEGVIIMSRNILNRDVTLNVCTHYADGILDSVSILSSMGESYSSGSEIEKRYRELINYKAPVETLLYTEETVKGKFSSIDVAKKHFICKGLLKHIKLVESSGCRIATINCNEDVLFVPNETDSTVKQFLELSDVLLDRDATVFSNFNL